MILDEFMTTRIASIDADASVYDAIEKMVDRRIRSLIVKFAGKDSIVISSSVDASLHCKKEEITSPLDVYYRIIYIPMYEKRVSIIKKNSDFLLEHFANKKLVLKSGSDTFRMLSNKRLEYFYEQGRLVTLNRIQDIKKGVKVFGTVATATTLFSGTPEDVYKESIAALENGTDFLCPGCGIAPNSPLENILQIKKARDDYFGANG